jgi:lipoate-protein ligase B
MQMISKQQLGSFEVLDTVGDPSDRRVSLMDYTSDPSCLIDFETAWDCQRDILNQHVGRLEVTASTQAKNSFMTTDDPAFSIGGCDTVIMLQHNPVYTLGTGSDEKFVLSSSKVPVVRMDRGGEGTNFSRKLGHARINR